MTLADSGIWRGEGNASPSSIVRDFLQRCASRTRSSWTSVSSTWIWFDCGSGTCCGCESLQVSDCGSDCAETESGTACGCGFDSD